MTHIPNRSPFYKFLNMAYNIHLSVYEDIRVVQHDLKWQSDIRMSIDSNKEVAIEAEKDNKDKIRVYLYGSLIDGRIGAAAVLYCNNRKSMIIHKYLRRIEHHTV